MSAKSVVDAVSGFLAHHVGDLTAIHSALSELVSVAPIDSQDKERINSVLQTIETSANNVNDFLEHNTLTGDSAGELTVKESDIVEALSNFFASDADKAALASAAGNGESHAG